MPSQTRIERVHRRGFLQAAAGATLGLASVGPLRAAAPDRQRVLRVAHLTDVHVQPERKADRGMIACLHHVQERQPKPDLILFGGDCVMDAFAARRDRTRLQWDMWQRVLRAENGVPHRAAIGNHDIWGWNQAKSEATGAEPDYGKNWAVEALAVPQRYYHFTQAGWHFIALDGVQPGERPGTYSAYLDEEQLDWLTGRLKSIPAQEPILIWSHIPLVSVMPLLSKRQTPTSKMEVGAGWVHTDAGLVAQLLGGFANVKLCLSGHLHLVDHCFVRGVNYHCNGAVSGSWWKGPNEGFPEGYAVVDLYSDGTYELEYVAYGWQAEPEEPKR
ncbi:MAG TPA: metallophosphoesterase [Gemmatales bacterium]|nr:metallophosphoesterase [Gemmatales bacterium]HMP57863.1 metallophosphoesterase [Gemmatales bacterium]